MKNCVVMLTCVAAVWTSNALGADRAQPARIRAKFVKQVYPGPANVGPSQFGSPNMAPPGAAGPQYGTAPLSPAPGYASPGYPAPGYGASGYGAPGYPAPGYAVPGYGAPGYPQPTYAAPSPSGRLPGSGLQFEQAPAEGYSSTTDQSPADAADAANGGRGWHTGGLSLIKRYLPFRDESVAPRMSKLVVRVPWNARLLIDGQETATPDGTWSYTSKRPLVPGVSYIHEVRVERLSDTGRVVSVRDVDVYLRLDRVTELTFH